MTLKKDKSQVGQAVTGAGSWHLQPNASEKIDSYAGHLAFFTTFDYFSCVLFGGKEKNRIFANEMNGTDSQRFSLFLLDLILYYY